MAGGKVTRLVGTGDWLGLGPMPEAVRSGAGTAAVLNELRAADIAYTNLEIPLTKRGYPFEKVTCLRADPAIVEDLVAAGVDIVTTSNNHALDYGIDGLRDTLATLERAGIKQVGAGENLEDARKTLVLNGPGGSVGFLAFCSVLPQGYAASPERPGVAPIHATAALVMEIRIAQEAPGVQPPVMTFAQKHDLEATVEGVRALKARSDFVVVCPHWGVSGQDNIMDYQREIAYALIDAGADLILGHHAHRLHGIEFYKGKPVFYSLGNFICEKLPGSANNPHMSFRGQRTPAVVNGQMRRDSVLVEARIRGGELQRLALLPLLIDDRGYPTWRPDGADHLASLLSSHSEGLGTAFQVEGGQLLIVPA